MSNIDLTEEQKNIINEDGNIVVVAVPGSGKTTTITHKINKVLLNIKEYQGIIAISYTNKASDELKHRVMKISSDIYNSFFGTIYAFYLSEIIFPFAKYLYSYYDEVEVISNEKFEKVKMTDFNSAEKINYLIKCFRNGKIILEEIPFFASNIIDSSNSCRLYLRNRYTHIFIDEYQDCDIIQHNVFKKIVDLGITGIAVGDPEQSIFKYSGCSPKYLLELSELSSFKSYGLSINHRSHESIINYAYKFLMPQNDYEIIEDKRVYKWNINGDETTMSKKIDCLIPRLIEKYDIKKNSEIAILCRSNNTAKIISNSLNTPSIYFCDTPIDKSSNDYEIFFKNLLIYLYGSQKIYPENILESTNLIINNRRFQKYVDKMIAIKSKYLQNNILPIDDMVELTQTIFGNNIDFTKIYHTLGSEQYLISYKALDPNRIHIMTIHKSKGLEFDAVFILDLHKYIVPKYDFNNNCYPDLQEDKCVHYVSLTRARKAVILSINSQRHNSRGDIKIGEESEFVSNYYRPDLIEYRN